MIEEARRVAAGALEPERAFMARHYRVPMLDATDAVLGAFEDEAAAPAGPSDERVLDAIERVVRGLNAVDEEFGAYETVEREELCEYVDAVLGEHGTDVAAFAERNGLGRHEITDRWRDW